MKKLLVSVNGVRFEVEVEVLEDDEEMSFVQQYKSPVPRINENIYSDQKNTLLKHQAAPSKPKAPAASSAAAGSNVLTAPLNGVVLEIPFKVGDSVKENDVVFVLEAMKMKTNISSPRSGVIKSIKVNVGDTIEAGQEILNYE